MKIIITESQYNLLTENKKKRLFTKVLGEDLIDSIRKITSVKQIPKEVVKVLGSHRLQEYIDLYGPFYSFVLDGELFIYKDRDEYELFYNDRGTFFDDRVINYRLGLSDIGFKFSNVINAIFNEEEHGDYIMPRLNSEDDEVISESIISNIYFRRRGINIDRLLGDILVDTKICNYSKLKTYFKHILERVIVRLYLNNETMKTEFESEEDSLENQIREFLIEEKLDLMIDYYKSICGRSPKY